DQWGGYRVEQDISVIPGIVAIQVTKVGNERRARINWQENFFQNRIRNRHAVVGVIFRVLIVQREIEGCEGKLASIESAGVSQFGVIHFFNGLGGNLFRRIAVIRRKSVEHL